MKDNLAILPFQSSTLLIENYSQNQWNFLQNQCSKYELIKNRLNRQKQKRFELQLTLSNDWLEFPWQGTSYSWFILQLTTSCGWFYPATDSNSAGWTRNAADLSFNISSKFKDLFCKIHHFYGLLFTTWFQLPLMQALTTASRTLKKLEEAWGSLKRPQDSSATDSYCSGWFKLRRLIRGLWAIDYLQNFDPDTPWYVWDTTSTHYTSFFLFMYTFV